MDIVRLYLDYSIPTADIDHRHYHDGWVNTGCPFCTGNPGMHLGYNVDEDYFHCWRCGGHPTIETLSQLIHISQDEARRIIKKYGGQSKHTEQPTVTIRRQAFKLPSDTGPLTPAHKRYLAGRGYDPDRLVDEWGLLSAGPLAKLDGLSYKHRIIIPIMWQGTIVSFQGRTTSDTVKPKYKACPKERESVHHQDIVYGDQQKWNDTGIIVEGVTDVWRFSGRACATFGIDVTRAQIRAIARAFRRVAVVFDNDKWAQWKGHVLVSELKFRGVEAWQVPIKDDPGSMSQREADKFIQKILKR